MNRPLISIASRISSDDAKDCDAVRNVADDIDVQKIRVYSAAEKTRRPPERYYLPRGLGYQYLRGSSRVAALSSRLPPCFALRLLSPGLES
jgi:hypothetical protein